MCLGVPYEVLEVEDRDTCLVRVGSGSRRCFTGFVDPVRPGDWLLVHAGFALSAIGPDAAMANLDLIRRALAGAEKTRPEPEGGGSGGAAGADGPGSAADAADAPDGDDARAGPSGGGGAGRGGPERP